MNNSTKKKILLIDDDFEILTLLQRYLEELNHEAPLAISGRAGIWLAQMMHPDLVFLDTKMPGLDGFEVFKRLREDESLEHCQIVFLITADEEKDMKKVLAAGGTGFLRKPFSRKDFIQTIDLHLEKSQNLGPLSARQFTEDYPGKQPPP